MVIIDIVNVHVTLLGLGSFNNPITALTKGLEKMADVVKDHPNVHVYIHCFDDGGVKTVINAQKVAAAKSPFGLGFMDAATFMAGGPKTAG
jgi:hypothetical protein